MSNKSINAILLKSSQMPHHTDLVRVFEAFDGLQRQYNWLLSGATEFFVDGQPMWMTGDELSNRVEHGVESGWSCCAWGVLSGFEPHQVIELTSPRFPYADGNP